MYGGNCTAEFFRSAFSLARDLTLSGVDHQWLVTDNESLITRARNTSVARFLQDEALKSYDALMFIDADIEFSSDDVAKLWNLNVPIATAAYPMKRGGSDVTAWKNGKLVSLNDLKDPIPVDYAGTGFLMIRRHVFKTLIENRPSIGHEEGKVGKCWAFFDTGLVDDGAGLWYCSEDYWFCRMARQSGFEIILEPSIRLGHVGRRVYR